MLFNEMGFFNVPSFALFIPMIMTRRNVRFILTPGLDYVIVHENESAIKQNLAAKEITPKAIEVILKNICKLPSKFLL
jgi:hypothetical protein